MVKTVQQEAFLFSHEIANRLPHVSGRLMELMILDSQELLAPKILSECVQLLQSHEDLLEDFGRLFLPGKAALEVWKDAKNEAYCMFVEGDSLTKLCRLLNTSSTTTVRHATVEAAAEAARTAVANLASKKRPSSAKASRVKSPSSARTPFRSPPRKVRAKSMGHELDDGDKKLPAQPWMPKRRPPTGKDISNSKRRSSGVPEEKSGVAISQRSLQPNETPPAQCKKPAKIAIKAEQKLPAPQPDRPLPTAATPQPNECAIEGDTNEKGHDAKSVVLVDKLLDGVSSYSASVATVLPAKKRRRRWSRKCDVPDKPYGNAQELLNDLTVFELKDAMRICKISSTGNRDVLLYKLTQHLAVDPKAPIHSLPEYIRKYREEISI